MSNKTDSLKKIRQHLEMLVAYGMMDEETASTLVSYLFDFVMEIDTIETDDINIESLKRLWEEDDNKND
jgi:hypothetical protein